MNRKEMNRKHLMALAAGPLLWASAASAVPIAAGSSLELKGSVVSQFMEAVGEQFTFQNPANVVESTGSFAAFGICDRCATVTEVVVFFNTTSSGFDFYMATNPGVLGAPPPHVSTALQVPGQDLHLLREQANLDPEELVFSFGGTGTATLDGFDPTPAEFFISMLGRENEPIPFNLIVSAVPAPLVGHGLAGVLAIGGLFLIGACWSAVRGFACLQPSSNLSV